MSGTQLLVRENQALAGAAIVERDENGEALLTWCFPSVPEKAKRILVRRTGLVSDEAELGGETQTRQLLRFSYSKFDDLWLYTLISLVDGSDEHVASNLPRVNAFATVVLSTTFNPEKYQVMCELLARAYAAHGNAVKVTEVYMSVFMKNSFTPNEEESRLGSFKAADYDNRLALLVTSLKDVIRIFGIESILLWVAMMTKKRIVVYAEKQAVLQKLIRGFPLFVWHRQDWGMLRPFCTMNDAEEEDLHSAGFYVAGFTDNGVGARDDLYDLYCNVGERTVSIADHAKGHFRLGAFHRDVANFLLKSAEHEEVTPQAMIKALAVKVKELLGRLEALQTTDSSGRKGITFASLEARNLPPQLDRFLYEVAEAEDMVLREVSEEGGETA